MSLKHEHDIKKEKDERKDPTSFLPEEEMSYEIKKKKKKKKKKQEDPFKDIEEKMTVVKEPDITALDPDIGKAMVDPEVTIKVENIEVDLDFNDFQSVFEPHHSDHSPLEPIVKLEEHHRDAVILTFESVINSKITHGGEVKPKIEDVESDPDSDSHFCKVCHLVFKNPRTLLMHQKRQHKRFRRYFQHICDHCGMSYDAKNSLVAHMRRKHGPDANKDDMLERACDICALVFKGLSRLRMHMRRKHGTYEESFKHVCEDCGLTYDKYASLIVHRRRKHINIPKPREVQWFTCPFCSKVFSRRETYARHIQRKHQVDDDDVKKEDGSEELLKNSITNEKSGEITCSYCPLMFSSLMYLKLHMRRKHNALTDDFRLKCKLCNLSYDKVESLKRHVRRKHDSGTYCAVCNKTFASREMYLDHSHTKTVKECNVCGLIFASQGGLAKHLKCTHKITAAKTVFCNICNEGFYDKRQLKPHYMRVHLQVTYTCNFCNKKFKAKESYRRHLIFKHPDSYVDEKNTHNCEKCPESFINEFELSKHINLVHLNTDIVIKKEEKDVIKDTFVCTKCTAEYATWDELRVHFEQMHFSTEETQCQKCGELMPRGELLKHMKLHEEIEITCKYCEFTTKNRISMTQHTLRHTNAATINCDFNGCRYKTFYEVAMAKHKRKHNDLGVKLQCASCPFQTMNKYILKYHEEAHTTGKKRYECDKCDYATVLPANLVQHKYKHATEKRFKCEVCPFATKYNTSLRFHVRKKHCDLPTLR